MMRYLVAFAFLGAATLAAIDYAHDRSRRESLNEFATNFTIARRRPQAAWDLRHAPSSDIAAAVVVRSAVADVVEPVQLSGLPEPVKNLWLESVEKHDEELRQAALLAAAAVRERPGLADHHSLLGRAHYLRARTSLRSDLLTRTQAWSVPLETAASLAPGGDAVWTFLGLAYLESWGSLSEEKHRIAIEALRRALLDPGFAQTMYPALLVILGPMSSVDLLPDASRTLEVALQMSAGLPRDALQTLIARWEREEWKSRVKDLAEVERRAARGDSLGTAQHCRSWAVNHRATDFDTPAARAQVVRILELWPAKFVDEWTSDPRAGLVRYLLTGRKRASDGDLLRRTVSSLRGTPSVIDARIRLLATDLEGAQILFERSATDGASEWTEYLVELALHWSRRGSPERAIAALDMIVPSARNECNVLVARREIARRRGDSREAERLAALLREATPASHSPADWSAQGFLSLCFMPALFQELSLNVESTRSEIVNYGWDLNRTGSVVTEPGGAATIRLNVDEMQGRHALRVWTMPGGTETIVASARLR